VFKELDLITCILENTGHWWKPQNIKRPYQDGPAANKSCSLSVQRQIHMLTILKIGKEITGTFTVVFWFSSLHAALQHHHQHKPDSTLTSSSYNYNIMLKQRNWHLP
jgi:hypothetical protein